MDTSFRTDTHFRHWQGQPENWTFMVSCVFKDFVYVHMCTSSLLLCVHMPHVCPQRPEEGDESPGAGVTGSFDLSNMGAGNPMHALCKSSRTLQTESSEVIIIHLYIF